MILNAGVALTQKYLTEEGLELHMATNHFGHFLLTNLLLPLMIQSAAEKATKAAKADKATKAGQDRSGYNDPGRIVVLSSLGHWWGKILSLIHI